MVRQACVLAHRWVGLALAAFLVVEGATGSLLAFNVELTRLFNPGLFVDPPAKDAKRLDPAELAERAEALVPGARVGYFARLRDDQAALRMAPRETPGGAPAVDLGFRYLLLDPYTGAEIGRLKENGYSRGFLANVMPFVYDLHVALALGDAGVWVLSAVAILWTIDSLVGFYLTLPPSRTHFWRKWKTAWLVKWRGGGFRLNFDLHRAGGLWAWALLLVFAWSSVNLTDRIGAYDAVMGAVFDYLSPIDEVGALYPSRGSDAPLALDWRAAQSIGETLVAREATERGFRIVSPAGLTRFDDSRQYNFYVRTDRTFPNDKIVTVLFDADTGALHALTQTATGHSGNTITNWLRALHTITDPVDYLAYRIVVSVFGLVVVMLSITGVIIWWRKRRARASVRVIEAAPLPATSK